MTPNTDTIAWEDIPTLDIDTLTLGEMAAAELASGESFDALIAAGRATRRLLALYVAELRRPSTNSAPRRSWSDLANLRPSVASSSPSRE